ncbi:MAG: hypothetical protein M1587_01495, partial [Thaumarchaeota archaeon]|nr:hypothetical protein [Nitrososphaerota archaeon]
MVKFRKRGRRKNALSTTIVMIVGVVVILSAAAIVGFGYEMKIPRTTSAQTYTGLGQSPTGYSTTSSSSSISSS